MSGIVPSTKWCGVDDVAVEYHDLGENQSLDKCCRQHDHCPIKIKPFSNTYGLFNLFSPYTKSHCQCDEIFYDCLKAANSEIADNIGKLFFNVIEMECIQSAEP